MVMMLVQIFHMLSCAREYGKLGMVCIGSSPAEARAIYDATFQRLLDSRQQDSSPLLSSSSSSTM